MRSKRSIDDDVVGERINVVNHEAFTQAVQNGDKNRKRHRLPSHEEERRPSSFFDFRESRLFNWARNLPISKPNHPPNDRSHHAEINETQNFMCLDTWCRLLHRLSYLASDVDRLRRRETIYRYIDR